MGAAQGPIWDIVCFVRASVLLHRAHIWATISLIPYYICESSSPQPPTYAAIINLQLQMQTATQAGIAKVGLFPLCGGKKV
jgi:hypothetical protein